MIRCGDEDCIKLNKTSEDISEKKFPGDAGAEGGGNLLHKNILENLKQYEVRFVVI